MHMHPTCTRHAARLQPIQEADTTQNTRGRRGAVLFVQLCRRKRSLEIARNCARITCTRGSQASTKATSTRSHRCMCVRPQACTHQAHPAAAAVSQRAAQHHRAAHTSAGCRGAPACWWQLASGTIGLQQGAAARAEHLHSWTQCTLPCCCCCCIRWSSQAAALPPTDTGSPPASFAATLSKMSATPAAVLADASTKSMFCLQQREAETETGSTVSTVSSDWWQKLHGEHCYTPRTVPAA